MKFVPPSFRGNAFNCPYPECQVYGYQDWQTILFCGQEKGDEFSYPGRGYDVSLCPSCQKHAFWYEETLIFPIEGALEIPNVNEDMPESAMIDYLEAGTIANKSPRSAAALLRLAIEKICTENRGKKESLNTAIGALFSEGVISRSVKESLDLLRLTGNDAVHVSRIDTDRDVNHVILLFELVNEVVEDLYTRPRLKKELFEKFPQTQLDKSRNEIVKIPYKTIDTGRQNPHLQ